MKKTIAVLMVMMFLALSAFP
ncbi:MAG: hypothetical protein UW91_C0058G0001, partial [Parcubacteria group bacterium GW2011_GWF2_45_11]